MKVRTISIVVLIAILAACISGCDTGQPQTQTTEEPVVEVTSPATTSADIGAYAMGNCVYNAEGEVLPEYLLDASGNITDEHGSIVVAAENVAVFTTITAVEATDENELRISIEAEKLADGTLATKPVTSVINLRVTPEDAVNGIIKIESRDPGALHFTYDDNCGMFAEEVERPENNALPSITIDTKNVVDLKITVVGAFDGEYTLVAANAFDEVVGEFTVRIVPEYVEPVTDEKPKEETGAEEGDGEHEHSFIDTVVAPTVTSRGYTIHECEICGYTYRDQYTEKLACTHEYKETVIPATYTTGGYTLHVCSICGESYRDNETPVLVCNHESTKDTVVKPTCTEQGYTLHECTICKNHSWKDSYTEPTGHKWNGGKVTQAATCGHPGVRTYTCKVCGETKTEEIPATGNHTYTEKVVAPTCDTGGYTLHTCSVCGDSYKDNYTEALGHTEPQWRTVKEATCGEDGVREGICARCGVVIATESIPKTGNHNYSDSVTSPTCTTGGCTTHTCTVCGHSYTDSATEPLGHDWVAHEEQVKVGQEMHIVCRDCGQDFNGWSQSQISAHMKEHVLNDENATGSYYTKMVDVYETQTVYICSRCGATK